MENNPNITNDSLESGSQLSISIRATKYLAETGRWGKMLSIIGFCFIGLIVIFSLFAGTIFSSLSGQSGAGNLPFPGFLISVVYILMGLIYLFPILYLFRFSIKIKTALLNKDGGILEVAFENLKSHYKFIGIFTVVFLGIYLLGGISALLFSSFI